MKIVISGKHMNLGNSLQEYVNEQVEKVVTKYFDRAVSAHIFFSKESYLFHTDIVVNDGTGHKLLTRGSASCDDAYSSFDLAITKIEKQLRRYKTKIKNHHKPNISEIEPELVKGVKYVISPAKYEDETEEVSEAPIIIAEKSTEIENLTVSEAVMKMDLAHLPALLFINKKNGRLNVVYHRTDGNISWVDPHN